MAIGARLRRWLLDPPPATAPDPDYLPLPVAPARLAQVFGDPHADPDGLAIAFLSAARGGDDDLRAAALRAIAASSGSWWARFDDALRETSQWVPRWSQQLAVAVGDDTADLVALVAAGCHRDGRLREAAAVRLAGHDHPVATAVLALRCADWAHQVREAARAAFDSQLAVELDTARLLLVADLAFTLHARKHGGWLMRQVEQLIPRLPDPVLATLLATAQPRLRRAAYRIAVAEGRVGVAQLLAAAFTDGDLGVRRVCADAAMDADTDLTTLRTLRASRTGSIRAEAIRRLSRAGEFDADAALSDPHPLVREIAQAAIRRRDGDPAPYYRRLVATDPPPPGAVAGLGETGTPADAALITPWLTHPTSRGRVAAIRALRRLGTGPADALAARLADPSPSVVRHAAAALSERATEIGKDELAALLRPENPIHVRVAGLRIGVARDPWTRLAVSLRLLHDNDEHLRGTAEREVRTWPGYGRLRPVDPQLVPELDRLLARAVPVLGKPLVDLIRFQARLG
ncbi:HEAT repeat domain-containing protein [Catellatospora methionotrophica]|uniref:HEAT repeat domain-containing protein n=1 Tax=Catellatospora methionotrophica TaxID=121620 RepID=UPI0033F9670F